MKDIFKEEFRVYVYEDFGRGRLINLGWLARLPCGDGRYDNIVPTNAECDAQVFDTAAAANVAGGAFIDKMNADEKFLPMAYTIEGKVVEV